MRPTVAVRSGWASAGYLLVVSMLVRGAFLCFGLCCVSVGARAQDDEVGTYLGRMQMGPNPAGDSRSAQAPRPARTAAQVDAIFVFRVPVLPSRAVPERALTPAMRAELARARRSSRFTSRPPRSLAAYNGWVQRSVMRRMEALRAVSSALEAYATPEHTDAERLVAAVTTAHLLADFASDIAALPLPREIDEDAGLARVYRAQIASTIAPFFERAGESFGYAAGLPMCESDASVRPLCDHAREAASAIEQLLAATRVAP